MVVFKFHKHPPSSEGTCLFGIPSVTSVKLLPFSFAAINVKCCGFLKLQFATIAAQSLLDLCCLTKGCFQWKGKKISKRRVQKQCLKTKSPQEVMEFHSFLLQDFKIIFKNIWIPGISRTINDKIIKPQDA